MKTNDRSTDHSSIKTTRKTSPSLRRLIDENAIGQLRRQEGLMETLGSENGAVKLDWVEGVARLLEDPSRLEQVETEARAICNRGIHHIIWAGMGGSIITVRVLTDLGFCNDPQSNSFAIYPLDSTDPAALNEIVRKIARSKNLTLPTSQESSNTTLLRTLLADVLMIGVSMGMTSEEPITHLTWFSELLKEAQLSAAEHLLVMTLPGSYLEDFAHEHSVPTLSLQLDGRTGTGGRMSAPTTRVFLLPVALYFASTSSSPGQLQTILRLAWQEYNLAHTTEQPASSPFVRLAAALSDASIDGACHLLLNMPQPWHPLIPWIEQLMEESLGKGSQGIIVFPNQPLNDDEPSRRGRLIVPTADVSAPAQTTTGTLPVKVITDNTESDKANTFLLYQPSLASPEPQNRLAALAASFLGWQLTMALYGYLHYITFAGQPAVENYKARARTLRKGHQFKVISKWRATTTNGPLTLLAPQTEKTAALSTIHTSPASIFTQALQQLITTNNPQSHLAYLDLTINGELPSAIVSTLDTHIHKIGNQLLGIPVKLRRAPAAYHSTEQSEMDGPAYLVSLRILTRNHEKSILGTYTDTFLSAQAISTWQAMLEQARPCFVLLIDGSQDEALEPLNHFFEDVEGYLKT